MKHLRLVLLLAAVLGTVGLASPARAGLLEDLVGSPAQETPAGPDGTTAVPVCQPLEVPGLPVGLGSCSGVYPGSIIESDNGTCTLNFLFTGADGDRYIGTAGHCVLATLPIGQNNGEQRFEEGQGPEARGADGVRIGEFAYAIQEIPKDFALIRLDPGVTASPQVPQFGGPTGVNDEITTGLSPMVLNNFGNSLGIGGPLANGKTFLALGLSDPDQVAATGVALPGDSGGPVVDEQGRAVGVLVNVGAQIPDALLTLESLDVGIVGISRLTPQVERAEDVLGFDLRLQTAPKL